MNAELGDPWPWTADVARAALERLRADEPWKDVFEAALLALDDERADHLMQLAREARAAWLPWLAAQGGCALCIGNASSGVAPALARAGFQVVLADRSAERLALGSARVLAASGRQAVLAQLGDAPRLPFGDGTFELVVQEHGLPQARAPWTFAWSELARVGREVAVSANNRLGYKRSAGRRGDFRVPSPFAYLQRALAPAPGERTLRGHRAELAAAGFERVRAFALYPHQSDFTHLVGLDGGGPELFVGPQERENRAKILAAKAGLFPWLTPSFAFLARRRGAGSEPARIERALDELAERTGEPRPSIEHAHATRGNTTLVMTRVAGAAADDPRGRWAVHVPLSQQQQDQLVRHHARLAEIRARFPRVPVPEPLWIGETRGLFLACERRLGGMTAPHSTGDQLVASRMFADAARDFATLTVRPAQAFDEADFERLVASRFALVARYAAVPATIEHLARLREEVRARLIGARFPLVLHHADLRSKHVQLARDGSVLGYLDWGSSEDCDLPYFDVLHLVAHERKHEADLSAAAAWRIVRERRELRAHERSALESYCAALGIDDRARAAIEAMYPVLVAGMAERNWDYSRPRWLARQFEL